MKIIYIIVVMGICSNLYADPSKWMHPEGRETEAKQVELWQNKFDASAAMKGDEKMEFLSLGLRNMGIRKNKGNESESVDALYQKIQAALLAIPGHATYYGSRITKAHAEMKQAVQDAAEGDRSGNESTKGNQFRNIEAEGLGTLENLPSPATIKVLGELLSEEWQNPLYIEGHQTWPPLCYFSVRTLTEMPLVRKPVTAPGGINDPSTLKAWQVWYEQIKSGSRTFRFEGDPTEYDLNGPAPGQKLQQIARADKRDAERAAGHKRESPGATTSAAEEPTNSSFSIVAILAVATATAGGIWYFLKKKNAAV